MMCAKLAILLLLSWVGLPSLAAQTTDMDCEVYSNHSGDFVRLKWKQESMNLNVVIINYQITWKCSESDHVHLFTPSSSPCDSNKTCQYVFKTESCFETCYYQITPVHYCFQSPVATTHTCKIGKNVPKQAVKVVAAERKGNDGFTIAVTFQTQQLTETFCDDSVTSAMIKVEKTSSDPELFYNTTKIKAVDSKEHLFSTTFRLDNAWRWKPFNFSLSVSNTVGDSPFANYIYIKGATNGDLPIHNYTFTVDATETSVSVHWEVSDLPATLLQSQFITGYMYHLYTPSGIAIADNSTQSSHAFHDLVPSQVYYVGSKLVTSDTSSWGPEMVLKNISTKGSHQTFHNRETYYLATITVLSLIVISMVIGVTLHSLKRKYQKRMFEKKEQDRFAFDNTANMSELSSNPDTFPQEPKSIVESVTAATSTKAESVVTPGAYVTLSPDDMFEAISPPGKQHQIQQLQQPNHRKSQISFDARSGSIAVHSNVDNMTGPTECVGVTSSPSDSAITGQYTDIPPGSFEHVSSTNEVADTSVVTGEYTSIPPASMEHTGAATDNATMSVVTGQYMDIPPVSTEQSSANTGNVEISVMIGQYVDVPPASTEHASNNSSVITGEYVKIPLGSTEHVGVTNTFFPAVGEYTELPPNCMIVSDV